MNSDIRRRISIGSSAWREILTQGAAGLEVRLNGQQVDQLTFHARELVRWNRRVNLTTVISPWEMAVKHFIDSMAAANWIPADAGLLDIGTGGGFPGLPLKIVRPDLSVTLIDASRKKISFLNHVIRTLGLTRINSRHMRAEDLAKADMVPLFEVIVCRALTSLDHFLALADPLLADHGILMAWKTPALKNERQEWIQLLASAGQVRGPSGRPYALRHIDYRLPDADTERTLVLMRRDGPARVAS